MLKRATFWSTVLLAAVHVCGVPASAAVLTVSQNGPLHSVSAALQAAGAGDVIEIHAGTYTGDLKLLRTVTLRGIGKPVIRGSGTGSVIEVLADGCTLRGLIVEHSGSDLQLEHAGLLLRSQSNVVENNEFRDILYGIYLFGSSGNVIRGNGIRGRPEIEPGERGAAIHFYSSPGNLIEDNHITEARDGFYIQNSGDNVIRNNVITHLRYGVHYMYSDRNSFENNRFSDNMAGAAIMYSRDIEFRGNSFVHNRGFGSFGILFQECDNCRAEGNLVLDNDTGIFMEAVRNSTFRGNIIAANDVALEIFSSSYGNLFSGNDFVENLSPLQLVGRTANVQWQSGGKGNYWSSYDGYDLNEDGIGDVPFKIQNVFEYLEGNHPRLRLYLYSPAAQALAVADRAFPVVQGSEEVDGAPLMQPIRPQVASREALPASSSNIPLGILSFAVSGIAAAVLRRGQRIDSRSGHSFDTAGQSGAS